jgi:hypothetical protein
MAYAVKGSISSDGRQITLRGKGPVELNEACQAVGIRDREITLRAFR